MDSKQRRRDAEELIRNAKKTLRELKREGASIKQSLRPNTRISFRRPKRRG